MNGNGINAYRQANVETADPKRLVIMSYDAVISSLISARDHYRADEFEEKARSLQRAIDILCALISALDFDKGGEVARNLEALYNFMVRRLTEADLNRDMKGFDETIRMLEELRSAWQEIFFGAPRAAALAVNIAPAREEGMAAAVTG
ncbi:MAG: flagellar export chaperone FliS [Syntrophales bacterium]|nr:flagellar export chaperone FliS [Syntrophales bacterium]MDD5531343.1 flagellar export chaperone FliS [Syntrophales bacterium]